MSYASLMVHLDPAAANHARLAVAATLAERFKADAIGVAACDPQPAPYFYAAYGDQVLGEDRARVEKQMEDLGKSFRDAMQGRAQHVNWRAALAAPDRFVAMEARAADLVIVGGDPERGLVDPMRELDVGDFVMKAGRPVLVVPPSVEPLRFDSAVLAWKDTREARRAAADALPLLRQCRKTIVAALVENADSDEAGRRRSAEDVAAWLTRHGIVAHTTVMPDFGDTVGQLAAIASQHHADVIVAGAYGHSRFSEWVFGGVTRELLTRIPRCLLLAH